jgi:glycosyltransferase involved in cell wall biosynthesis
LLRQNCKDFVWLIVDDGSQDNTAELVNRWTEEDNGFEIRYIYKENGGMHTAHNTAYENIDTEMNVCIDSDDCMADGAVEKILAKWQQVKEHGYAGIIALDADLSGNIIGTGFSDGMTETTLCGYYAAGGSGDKKLIYRTDVINKYPPYPVFEGEKYVALAYKYRLIDQEFKLAILDEVVCNVEYQADGHSHGMWKEYVRSPKGFAFWRKVCMQYPESPKRLVVDCIHYVAESLIAKEKHFINQSPRKLLTVFVLPLGLLFKMLIMQYSKE